MLLKMYNFYPILEMSGGDRALSVDSRFEKNFASGIKNPTLLYCKDFITNYDSVS